MSSSEEEVEIKGTFSKHSLIGTINRRNRRKGVPCVTVSEENTPLTAGALLTLLKDGRKPYQRFVPTQVGIKEGTEKSSEEEG
jgi:hypothetical protein